MSITLISSTRGLDKGVNLKSRFRPKHSKCVHQESSPLYIITINTRSRLLFRQGADMTDTLMISTALSRADICLR